jgi:hypothetical protein
MEQWNDGILGPLVLHLVEKKYCSWDKQTMKLCGFDHYSIIPTFHNSMRLSKTMTAKSTVIPIDCINSITLY